MQYASCACGKRTYPTRKAAKDARKKLHAGDSALRPYECGRVAGNWHLGHIHPEVANGTASRDEFYRKAAQR